MSDDLDRDDPALDVRAWIAGIDETLVAIDARLDEVTDPVELARIHRDVTVRIGKSINLITTKVVGLFHDAAKGEEVEVDGEVIYPTFSKDSEQWDGKRIASKVAARLADDYYDRETGEAVPPAVFTEHAVMVTAAALGGFAPSRKWNVGELKKHGIDVAKKAEDETPLRSWTRGAKKIGVKRPATATAPAAPDDGEEDAA